MSTAKRNPPVGAHGSGGLSTNLTRSWIAVALIPVAFVPAFAVGEAHTQCWVTSRRMRQNRCGSRSWLAPQRLLCSWSPVPQRFGTPTRRERRAIMLR
jgi:hypothetical protein